MNAPTISVIAWWVVTFMVIAWVWRHREKPAPTVDAVDEANQTMHRAFADVGDSMRLVMPRRDLDHVFDEAIRGMKEAIKEERERVYQAGYLVGLNEPEHVDVAALFESMRTRFHLEEEDDPTEEDYLDGQREGELERHRRLAQQLDLFEPRP